MSGEQYFPELQMKANILKTIDNLQQAKIYLCRCKLLAKGEGPLYRERVEETVNSCLKVIDRQVPELERLYMMGLGK